MGQHNCTFCKPGQVRTNIYHNASSGDVILVFLSGNIWQIPDMILHYTFDHGWKPDERFVQDVLNSDLVGGTRMQTRGGESSPQQLMEGAIPIGYLTQPFISSPMSDAKGFVRKLEHLMHVINSRSGYMVNYRNYDRNKPTFRFSRTN